MATSKNSETNAAKQIDNGGTFILSDAELTGLSGTRGRKSVDSVYLVEVQNAKDHPTVFTAKDGLVSGDIHAIKITDTRKAAWIGPQLRKAAKQLGIDTKDFTVLDRSGSVTSHAPMGFVAYWVKDATAPVAE